MADLLGSPQKIAQGGDGSAVNGTPNRIPVEFADSPSKMSADSSLEQSSNIKTKVRVVIKSF